MRSPRTPAIRTEPLIWLCRRLSSALQADRSVLEALDSVAREAAPEVRELLAPMRATVAAGRLMNRGLAAAGAPAWVWGSLYAAETWAATAYGLERIADQLEAEANLPKLAGSRLGEFGVALARVGLMLELKVPILTALEVAADSLANADVRAELLSARNAVRSGADLSEAFAQCCAGLPESTIDMIRDAEGEGRLPAALPVIADYLFDVAGQQPKRRRKQEARNA